MVAQNLSFYVSFSSYENNNRDDNHIWSKSVKRLNTSVLFLITPNNFFSPFMISNKDSTLDETVISYNIKNLKVP